MKEEEKKRKKADTMVDTRKERSDTVGRNERR